MKNKKNSIFSPALWAVFALLAATACNAQTVKEKNKEKKDTMIESRHPQWSKNSNIYEVNIRQYTPEGTFAAFEKHLPRLQKMHTDILWLMPVFPIGEKNRKGSLGSYYSIKDYKKVNPEFGTLDDLKRLVQSAHEKGMHVILDWVANHTAWDHVWVKDHPDWYERDEKGNFKSPFDWTDVIELNYNNPEMRKAMIDAMRYWIEETGIDGFRCDVAGMVPTDFWNEAKTQLDKTKHIFMLAEDEENADLVKYAFDMNYTWKMMHLMNEIAKGEKKAGDINGYFRWNNQHFGSDVYRMYFTSNHDENSWNGTCFERLGDAFELFTVFDYTVPGIPLVYSGQEAGNQKRLRFFEKDTIDWSSLPYEALYASLNKLKRDNIALWNGNYGGTFNLLSAEDDPVFYAYYREKENNRVVVILNLGKKEGSFKLEHEKIKGVYRNYFTGEKINIVSDWIFHLPARGYVVLVQE